ncbi:MAG: hypothetical protein OXM57_04800 [bacterium]|nr:hypothetical protein [bacterium]MDE0351986.1 hypothetical protein [bacterium]
MTMIKESTVANRVAQSLVFLERAEAEFAIGDTRQGAEKLYGAAVQAIIAASLQRGWKYDSHRANKNASVEMAREYGDSSLINGFSAAEKLHIHFHHDNMEDYQIAADRHGVRGYVEHLLALVEEYEERGEDRQEPLG